MKTRRKYKVLIFVSGILFFLSFVLAAPTGPDSVNITANETAGVVAPYSLNVSGGYIATMNITANVQNVRWKAFVGNVIGSFTLDDASGSTIYDWSITSVGGEVYAVRNITSLSWASIRCANTTLMETENYRMNHTSADDNITRTFNDNDHSAFVVATTSISANSCPTLNTYKNSASQDVDFEEVILTDEVGNFTFNNQSRLIFSTILETDVSGFDNINYDFQMIVPEYGIQGYTGITPYYLYVELS